jgi:hypothetical protein
MLWEMVGPIGAHRQISRRWNTGGNNLANQLIMDGMKLQPCSPGFVNWRNAILAADQALTGGANQCIIWKAFAKRGLGSAPGAVPAALPTEQQPLIYHPPV